MQHERGWLKWGFVAPALVLLLAMNVFPLLASIWLGFSDAPLAPTEDPVTWVGGANYARVFGGDPEFAAALATTGLFVVLAVGIELALGFALAMCLRDRHRLPGRAVVLTVLLVPMMLSPAVMGLFASYVLGGSSGVVNQALAAVTGGTASAMPGWTTVPWLKFVSILAVDVWMWTPFMMLIALAGLNAIPRHLYEAAEIDRAGPWLVFRRITLPGCLPLVVLAVLLRITDALKQFDLVMAIAGPGEGRTQTLSVKLYETMFTGSQHLGFGCAYAVVCLVMVIGLAVIITRYLDRIRGGT